MFKVVGEGWVAGQPGTKALKQNCSVGNEPVLETDKDLGFRGKTLHQPKGQGGEGFLYTVNQSLASVHLRVSHTPLKIL